MDAEDKQSTIDRLVAACHGRSDLSCLAEVTKIVEEIEAHYFHLGITFAYMTLKAIVIEYMTKASLLQKISDYLSWRKGLREVDKVMFDSDK